MFSIHSSAMRTVRWRSLTTASGAALLLMASPAARAQDAAAGDVETVMVTGTSIRGVTAPVGSNIISVGREDIDNIGGAQVADVIAKVPALSNMGNDGRGEGGNGGPGNAVYIHQLGASANNATLVLIDGHRTPIQGIGNSLVDANLIPQSMLERVEVLADGSSSIYGSDALAGVVNFITRKNFDGLQLHYQQQYEHGAAVGTVADVLAGQNWSGGGYIATYDFSFQGAIANTSLWRTNPAVIPALAAKAGATGTNGGTTHFLTFNCSPASILPSGSSNIYYNAQSAENVANTAANARCSTWAYGDYAPGDTHQHAMFKFHQSLADSLTLNADALYYTRRDQQKVSRGTLTGTAFETGAQANPFYTNPPGVTATKQTVYYDFNELLGPGATSKDGDDELMGDADLNWDVNGNWNIDLMASVGFSNFFQNETNGVVNTGMALLALNGTNQSSGTIPAGTPTSTAVIGTNTVVTNLPLTTDNALDVWDPAATNKTSAATKNALTVSTANRTFNRYINSYQQFRLTANGTLFTTAAGPVKVAAGVEQFNSQYDEGRVTPENAGPTSVSSALFMFHVGRKVTSEYLEADIPVVGPNMHVPFVQNLEFDVSARHDGYNDVGQTTNPKAAVNWDIMDGLRILANWSTSFSAQALLHDVVNGVSGNSAVSSSTPGPLPVALYPAVTQLGIPGCTAASTFCNTSTLQGLAINDSTFNMKPQTGHSWTLGVKYAPSYLPGFTADISWWHTTLLGGITAASPQTDAFNPLLNNRIILFPPSVTGNGTPCATQAQIAAIAGAAPYTAVVPSCVSVIINTSDDNLIDFWASGIDATIGYQFDTDYGTIAVDDNISYETTYLQGFGENGVVPPAQYRFEVRNTNGLNTAYPNIGTQMRGHLGWALDDFGADLYVNYIGPYKNVSNTATTAIGTTAYSVYSGQGGDHVDSYTTFDLHLSYQFNAGVLGDDRLSLSARNLLNASAPFFNGSTGYDPYVANPLGRIVELGITAKM